MGLWFYLGQPFAQHALLAGTLVAITSGLIGPFIVTRKMAFAVHGTAELSFTGAAAGLLVVGDPVVGALAGSLVVATAIGLLGVRERERDSAIGVILAFGLGVGVYLLSLYHGFATEATNILFGQIFGVSSGQLLLLLGVAAGVLVATTILYRQLLFASVDADVAEARGVRLRLVGLLFLFVLALTVTEAAQIVGTLLVLSLAITPAAGFVNGWGAMAMGIIASTLVYFALNYMSRLRPFRNVDDTLGVFYTHGIAGFLGGLLTGVFADPNMVVYQGLGKTASVAAQPGVVHGGFTQLKWQFFAGIFVIAWSTVATFILLKFVGLFVPLRMSEEDMEIGDTAVHGHEVYPSDIPSLGYPNGVPGLASGSGSTATTPA